MTLHGITLRPGDWVWSLSAHTWVGIGNNITADFVSKNQRKFVWYSPLDVKKKLRELDKRSQESSKEEPIPA